jgi:hypothetical protein
LRALIVAAVALFAVHPLTASDVDVVSTFCREVDVPLDASHSASRLVSCDDSATVDLLWHLDRIDQLEGNLDGKYHRHHAGAGSVVYVMDTGVLSTHDEFADALGTRVIAGFDMADSVTVGASTRPFSHVSRIWSSWPAHRTERALLRWWPAATSAWRRKR